MNAMDSEDDARYGQQQPRRYYGKYAGLVTENGPPSSGSHRGQVKVKVPGILEETADGNGSQPIEVLAAPAFLPGFFFVPEEQDPVWVEFVAGDINFPIWTGVWYPEDATPSTVGGDAPTLDQKVIRTKSGHVIQLDDTSGSEQLVIKDETNGNIITLDQNGVKIEATASGGSVTLMFGQTTVTLKGDSFEIEQGGTHSVKLDATGVTVSDTTGTNQGVVLTPIIQQWLMTHTHIGNLGAPTPLNPADIATLTANPSFASKAG